MWGNKLTEECQRAMVDFAIAQQNEKKEERRGENTRPHGDEERNATVVRKRREGEGEEKEIDRWTVQRRILDGGGVLTCIWKPGNGK